MRIYNEILTLAGVVNASFNSKTLKLDQSFGYAIQVVFTGNPAGTLKLQACADSVQQKTSPATWSDIAETSLSISGAGSTLFNVTDAMYNYVRVVYTDSSGGTATGTCTITGNSKGV